jgi:anti-sigma factor RsiW
MSVHSASFRVGSKLRCWSVDERLSAYADGSLPLPERQEVAEHLRQCGACSLRAEQLSEVRGRLRALPVAVAPSELATGLRIVASREMARQQAAAQSNFWSSLHIRVENLMRPLALPFAGGLVSALFLFSMLVPTYPLWDRSDTGDVATPFYTEASVKSVAPFGPGIDDIVIDLVVDEEGRVLDYSLPRGDPGMTPALRRAIENSLLFVRFTPATSFGQPTQGRIRLSFRRSSVDVKG